MQLMGVYIVIVIIGELIAYGIGRTFEAMLPGPSLTVFLALFFSVFFFGWQLAVRLTAPKSA